MSGRSRQPETELRLPPFLARVETATLLLALCVAGFIWAFFSLAGEIGEGDLTRLDRVVMLLLRNPADPADPLGGPMIELAMRDVTALGGVTVLTLLVTAVTLYLLVKGRQRHAVLLLGAVAGGQVLSNLAKAIYDRPRPDLVPHGVEVTSASFPSGHAMMATSVYLLLGVMLARVEPKRRLKILYLLTALVLAVLVGISRVYLGVHWPSDVMAGWVAGAGWALACNLIARAWIGEQAT
jgi:undecaprenyl-diphosphatase